MYQVVVLIFYYFHPYLGKWSKFDLRIFFRWVAKNHELDVGKYTISRVITPVSHLFSTIYRGPITPFTTGSGANLQVDIGKYTTDGIHPRPSWNLYWSLIREILPEESDLSTHGTSFLDIFHGNLRVPPLCHPPRKQGLIKGQWWLIIP